MRPTVLGIQNKKRALGIYLEATRSKKLLGTKGIATGSKDATRGSWPYY